MEFYRTPTSRSETFLPKSGQITSYRDGDDGYFQIGNSISPRFTDMGNGIIFDAVTRLYWVKQPELIIPGAVGIHSTNQIQTAKGNWANDTAYALADLAKDIVGSTYWVCVVAHTSAAAGTFAADRTANPTYWRESVWTGSAANLVTRASVTWNNAIDQCLALEYAGYTDWRLPNINESLSLVDATMDVLPTFFPNLGGVYWTSTTYYVATTNAWQNDYDTGIAIVSKTGTLNALPVRGGI